MRCPHSDVEYCRCDERVVSDDEWEAMETERDRYKAALKEIVKSAEFYDGYPGGDATAGVLGKIARRALRGEQGEP